MQKEKKRKIHLLVEVLKAVKNMVLRAKHIRQPGKTSFSPINQPQLITNSLVITNQDSLSPTQMIALI